MADASVDNEKWIRENIKQRKCVVFCKWDDEHSSLCKCFREKTWHENSDSVTADIWTISKNTESEACTNFGKIQFEDNKSSEFVRCDVRSDLSTIEHLLVNVWKLSKPQWVFSFMGDVHEGKAVPSEILQNQMRNVITSFSNGQNIWITSEGINFGAAKIIGEILGDHTEVTPVGIYSWGACDEDALEVLKSEKKLLDTAEGNRPGVLYPHHLLVDDGTENTAFCHQSFQDFRLRLETHIVRHPDASTPIPLVVLLYGGWSYVIDGVKAALDNNIPIVVLQGTGGFADILATVFNTSKKDILNARGNDDSLVWTGTVIDDGLRKEVKDQFKAVHGSAYKAGEHRILQCLQKRELITVVNIHEENTLSNGIIQALLKCKPLPEVLRLLDYYMPAPLFEEAGAAQAAFDVEGRIRHAQRKTTGLFLLEAMLMDKSECAQYIIDYDGVDLVDFTKVIEGVMFTSYTRDKDPTKYEAYQYLLSWAVQTGKKKCAALFWKKGKDLLASSLVINLRLRGMMDEEKNIGKKRDLEEHAELFEKRAEGLMKGCYDDSSEKTMTLIQSQALRNIWGENLLQCCLAKGNRKIFATEAFKRYIEHVWYGRINPPNQRTYKRPKTTYQITAQSGDVEVLKRNKVPPVATYALHLIFYIIFLCIFGYTLLCELGPTYTFLEGILVLWWLAFVVEEIRQFITTQVPSQTQGRKGCCTTLSYKLQGYFLENHWNILDCVCLLFFLTGGILMTLFHVDNTRTGIYQAARVVLSLDMMFFTWRILQYLAVFSIMGPVLKMIYQMVKDLIPFLIILFVFIISQGLAAQSLLYPNTPWSAETFLNIPKSAFWNVFGELGLEDLEACDTNSSDPIQCEHRKEDDCPSTLGTYAVPFLLAMHMLLTNVLLLNIIIARFSYTYQHVWNQVNWMATWQKAKVTLEYYDKPPLPPPLNVVFYIPYKICEHTCCKVPEVSANDAHIASWERSMAEYYRAQAEFKSGSERMSVMSSLNDVNHISYSL